MVDAVQLLVGIERMLAPRTQPIPVHVMRACLRVAADALQGQPSPERAVVEQLMTACLEGAPDTAAEGKRRGRAPAGTQEERLARKRQRQREWKRQKDARRRNEINGAGATEAEAAQDGLADAVAAAAARFGEAAAAVAPQVQAAMEGFATTAAPIVADMVRQVDAVIERAQQHEALAAFPPSELDALRQAVRTRMARQRLSFTAAERQMGMNGGCLNAWVNGSTSRPAADAARAWLATPETVALPNRTPNEAPPPDLSALEAVPASIEDATNWLYEELLRERGARAKHAEIEQRLALFTPRGLLTECNTRRVRHGLPPYAIAARADAPGARSAVA